MAILDRIIDRLSVASARLAQPQASSSPPGMQRIAQQQTQDMTLMGAGQQGGGVVPPDMTQPHVDDLDARTVLERIAAGKGAGDAWRSSTAALLELLDLDSDAQSRRTLATELGSAAEDPALHAALARKLGLR